VTAAASPSKARAQVNRESYLQQAVKALRPHFRAAGVDLPAVRVSCGWPGGHTRPSKGKTITGQCWTSAKDGRAQIFISPTIDNAMDALGVLVHELCHASDGNKHGHDREFAALAYAVGLTGKPTETTCGGELQLKLAGIVKRLGRYPHSALLPDSGDGKKKQGTRMVKVICPETDTECAGYTVRTTAKWLELGTPACPQGHEMVVPAEEADKRGITMVDFDSE
jgi:hypothetical protein